MAAENRTGNSGPEKPIQNKGTGEPTGNPGTKTPTERTGTGTGTGTPTGTDKEKGISGLAPVNEVPTPAEPKKAKKKRTRTNNKKNDAPFNAEQIKGILMVMSGVMSQSEAGKIFALTEGEAEQIANPLANIIAKNDSLAGLGEHADSVALITACLMIFIPRLIIFLQYQKNKKALKDKNIKIVKGVEKNEQKGTPAGNSTGPNRNVTSGGVNGGENILSSIPSLA